MIPPGHVSIHALRGKRDHNAQLYKSTCFQFQSTRSGGSATSFLGLIIFLFSGFNPRAPGEARHPVRATINGAGKFQSTRSGGSATPGPCAPWGPGRVSIHALRGKRDAAAYATLRASRVSIHALRGKRDPEKAVILANIIVSIHALRGKRDATSWTDFVIKLVSIHALRGKRDLRRAAPPAPGRRFNPRAPGEARLVYTNTTSKFNWFQSTRSGGSATYTRFVGTNSNSPFQSTRSGGSATNVVGGAVGDQIVSIHALRGKRDWIFCDRWRLWVGFNPRAPGEARRLARLLHAWIHCFNPRAPGEARLIDTCDPSIIKYVSIHALRGKRDFTCRLSHP